MELTAEAFVVAGMVIAGMLALLIMSAAGMCFLIVAAILFGIEMAKDGIRSLSGRKRKWPKPRI